MWKSILLAAVLGIAVATVTRAENAAVQKADTAVSPVKVAKPVTSNALRLSDAELDKITAGKAEVITGGGLTIVLNPGNAEILKFNKNRIICINCF